MYALNAENIMNTKLSNSIIENRIKELEQKIQKEIWRIQMIDYPTPNTKNELHKMQKELKEHRKHDGNRKNEYDSSIKRRK